MIKGKAEAEASDVAVSTASTQPPVGGEGATLSVGVGPSAAAVGAVKGAAEASVGDATSGAAARAVPGETGDQTAVAAPKEDEPAAVQPDKPSETADAPAPAAPGATVVEGSTGGQEAPVVDPKGEVDTAGGDTQEKGGLSEAHLAELKKSKGTFGGLFKNSCLQAEVKTPADGEAGPNASTEPEATDKDKPEAAGDATVPETTDDAPSQTTPVAEAQAPPAETPSGESKRSKRIFFRRKKSESGVPAGVAGAEPAAPAAETGGDGDAEAPAAPAPSESAAPALPGDAVKPPEDADDEKIEGKAQEMPPEESKPKKSFLNLNFLRKSSLPDSGAADADVATCDPETSADADTKAPAASTQGAVESASAAADESNPPADAVAGEAKATDEQDTERNKPVKETKPKKNFLFFRKPSMPDSGGAGDNVTASATGAPGDADTKAPAAPTEAAAPSTSDPAEAKPEDAATDPKLEDVQACEAEAPTADAKPKKRSMIGSIFRKPSMPDPAAGDTEAPASAPAPDKAGVPESEPVPDATTDAENPTVKPEGGQEACQEASQEEVSSEKTKRKLIPKLFSRRPSMPDSGAADSEATEPAQENPGEADTKAPAPATSTATAEGVETTNTDQPAVPAPDGGENPKGDEAKPEEQAAAAVTSAPTADAKKGRTFGLFKRRSLSNAETAAASAFGEASALAVDAPAPSAPTTSGDAAVPSSSADAPAQSSSADMPAPPSGSEAEANFEVGAQDAPVEAQATAPGTSSSAKKSRINFRRFFSRNLSTAEAEPSGAESTTAAPEGSGEGEVAAKPGDASQSSGEASAPSAPTDPPASSGAGPDAGKLNEADPSAPKDVKTDTPATVPDSTSSNVKKPSRFSLFARKSSQKAVEAPAADVPSKPEAIAGTETSAPAVPEPNAQPAVSADKGVEPIPASTEVTVS